MKEIQENKTYAHLSGMQYKVKQIILDATNYEKGIEPKRVILYEQLDDGKFPKGTIVLNKNKSVFPNFNLVKFDFCDTICIEIDNF